MRNRTALWVNFAFAAVVVVAVFFQVYFIAAYVTGSEESALDAHRFVGGLVVHPAELVVFLSALVAFWRNWSWIAVTFGLFALGTIQIALAPGDDPGSGWVHGLHGLLALFVLVYAAYIAYRGARRLGLRGPAEPTLASGPPPAV